MKIIELRSQNVQARPVPPSETGGAEMYEIAFIDKDTHDVMFIRFDKALRDALIGQLHGTGIVVAGRLPTH